MSRIGCITPGCGRVRFVRGMCRTCYSRAWLLVKAGKVTWAELERQGRAVPHQTRAERNRTHAAVIGAGR